MQKPNIKKSVRSVPFFKQAGQYGEQFLKSMFHLGARFGQGPEMAANNYKLGLMHLGKGNYGDAVFRFKAVTWLEPANVMAWYNLGTAYLADNKPATAASAYKRALQLKPDYEEASYMLAIARGAKAAPEDMPKRIPLSLAESHFDAQAPHYEKDQIDVLKYRGHIAVDEAIRAHGTPGRVDHELLDLGCGTGLVGPVVRNLSAHITGVDISQPMLSIAMEAKDSTGKKAYDVLIKREAQAFLNEAPAEAYDIVVAAGLFSFIGELDSLFKAIATVLKPGGLLVFTAEKNSAEGMRFEPAEGRFRFGKSYLQDKAQAAGLAQLALSEAQLQVGPTSWVGVFKK